MIERDIHSGSKNCVVPTAISDSKKKFVKNSDLDRSRIIFLINIYRNNDNVDRKFTLKFLMK